MKRQAFISLVCQLLAVVIFLIVTGCSSKWSLSDEEAIKIVKDYYSFNEAKEVDVKILNRGEFISECKCYPIEFQITHLNYGHFKTTFYFYKKDGRIDIKKFKV